MLSPGTDQARQLVAEARQVRDAAAARIGSGTHDRSAILISSLSQLIDLTEALIAERAQYESRLQRSAPADFTPPLDAGSHR